MVELVGLGQDFDGPAKKPHLEQNVIPHQPEFFLNGLFFR